MKKVALLVVLALGVAVGSLSWAEHHGGEGHVHGEAGWFDVESCDICQPMAAHQKMMMEVEWETHKIGNGMLMVAIIPEKHQELFNGLCEKMHEMGAELAGKESTNMCGFCQAMGKLMQAGAKEEIVKGKAGNFTLITASDPETVKKIHQVAERTQKEAKKMEEMMAKMQKPE